MPQPIQPDFNRTEKVLRQQQAQQQMRQPQQPYPQQKPITQETVIRKKISPGMIIKFIFVIVLLALVIYVFLNPDKIMAYVNNFFGQYSV